MIPARDLSGRHLLTTYGALVNDLRGHAYCCGGERGSFQTISIAGIYFSCSVSVQELYSLVISLLSSLIPEIAHFFLVLSFFLKKLHFIFLGACPVFNFVLAWLAKVGCVVCSSGFVLSGLAPLLYL